MQGQAFAKDLFKQIHYRLFLLVVFVLFGGLIHAQEEWTLKTDRDGIRVYSRTNAKSKFNELKVSCRMDSKLSGLAAVLLDVNEYKAWVYNTSESVLLNKISETELYFYEQIHSPWGTSNRDLAVHLIMKQDPQSKALTIKVNSVPDYIPEKKSFVRVPLSNENWTVTSVGPAMIQIDYFLKQIPEAAYPPGSSISFLPGDLTSPSIN